MQCLSISGPGQARVATGWSLANLVTVTWNPGIYLYLHQDSDRAYLHSPAPMSWAEAEDYCQTVYGHLATDDSAGHLRTFVSSRGLGGAVWIGLHQSRPQTQFTWT